MAPEVIRSEPYCTAVDVYSFAILTYCVVSGTAYPYEDRYITPAQAAMGVAKQDLRPNLSSRMPPALASIITSCWDKDANQRPNIVTVVDMLETARTVLANKKHAKVGNSWGAWLWG